MMADESCLKPLSTIRYIKYEKYSIRDIVVVIFMAHQASFWVLLACVGFIWYSYQTKNSEVAKQGGKDPIAHAMQQLIPC